LPLFLALVVLVGVIAGFDRDGPARVGEELGMSACVVDSVATAADQSKRSLLALVCLLEAPPQQSRPDDEERPCSGEHHAQSQQPDGEG
jgi:hypothetical protein